jgi:hypothetical protein
MLIFLLGPPIAIFSRHDTRYFFAFSPRCKSAADSSRRRAASGSIPCAPAALLESWRRAPSIECDANPGFFAPNNLALPGHLIGLNDQLKFVGNAERTWNVKGGADL